MKGRDHIAIGLAVGLLLPALVIGIVYLIFIIGELEPTEDLMSQVSFLGIATNIFPTKIFSKREMEMSSRGVMAITMLMVVLWAIQFLLL